MKIRQFIILGVFVLILGMIYFPILQNKSVDKKTTVEKSLNYLPVLVAINKEKAQLLTSYGQILPNNQIDVSMEVQGKIKMDNPPLKAGITFKKGDVLVQIERIDALYNLLARRSSFVNLISGLLPDISIDYPSEKEKWENYLNQLNETSPLPELPKTNSRKEKLLVNQRNIPSEYYSIKAQENQIEKYFFLAPFNGTIISSSVEPGSMVTPGMRIITIAKTDDYEVKVPILMDQLEGFKNAKHITFTTTKQDTIGEGKFLRLSKSINQQTQSVDAYFSIDRLNNQSIFQGMFVNLTVGSDIKQKSIALPEAAVRNGQVQVLKDSLITLRKVTILGNARDSLFIEGVKDNELIVLEPYSTPQDSTKFVGIQK